MSGDTFTLKPQVGELQFSILGETDLPAILELEKLAFSLPWSEQQYNTLLAGGVCRLFGIKGEGGLLAYAAAAMIKPAQEVELYNIAVRPELRRHGLGKRLLGLVLAAAAKSGTRRAVLEVREHNAPAIGLYESLGFNLCGRRRAYYSDTGEDALLYELDLD